MPGELMQTAIQDIGTIILQDFGVIIITRIQVIFMGRITMTATGVQPVVGA
tara:strand:+ start:124 stop:276 length:153 start_codon:yes stop_codon:yes gene_type:complete